MSELFDIPETLSPKLAWMRKHDCRTRRVMTGWLSAFRDDPEFLLQYDDFNDSSEAGNGFTEDEAILDLCNKTGVTHWTVESL